MLLADELEDYVANLGLRGRFEPRQLCQRPSVVSQASISILVCGSTMLVSVSRATSVNETYPVILIHYGYLMAKISSAIFGEKACIALNVITLDRVDNPTSLIGASVADMARFLPVMTLVA
ncbi:hypothetical protein ACVWZA_004399 [Sphingomonas sp. UYAg733]